MKNSRLIAGLCLAFCAGLFTQTQVQAATVTFSTSSSTDTNTTALTVAPGSTFTLDIYGNSTLNFNGFDLDLVSNTTGSQVQITGQTLGSNFFDLGAPTLPITLTSTAPAPELADAFSTSSNLNSGTNYLLATDTFSISSPGAYTISLADTDFEDTTASTLDVAGPESVTITVTPEPSTWALMLGGCALLAGWQFRRRLAAR